jgi:hypothetical protein
VSGANGRYEVRYLVPGDYVVQVALSGFRTERRTFTLRVSQLIRVDVALQVGNLTDTVEVVATGQLLETQSGVTGNVVTEETIANLPLSDRNVAALGNLTAALSRRTASSAPAGPEAWTSRSPATE